MTTLPAPPPDQLARLLPPDVDLSHPARHAAARPVWLGVVWSRLGRGDLAWAFWDRVGAAAVQPWVAAERGRVLRELGLHAEAERLEWPALAAAEDAVDRAMLQVSLAADAVGRGDVPTAVRRHAAAREAVGALPTSPRAARQRLRLTWVGVEVAWVRGTTPSGAGLPRLTAPHRHPDARDRHPEDHHDARDRHRDARDRHPDPHRDDRPDAPDRPDDDLVLPADLAHGSAFHRAKALLFGGLVAGSLPLLDRAAAEAPPVLEWAVHLARADHGADGALAAARRAWGAVVPPPDHAPQVHDTPTARRLAAADGD